MAEIRRINKIETKDNDYKTWEVAEEEVILRIPYSNMILEYYLPLDELRNALREKE